MAEYYRHAGFPLQKPRRRRRVIAPGQHVELHVGRLQPRPRGHEADHHAGIPGQHARMRGVVLGDPLEEAEAARLLIQRDLLVDPECQARREMVAVVLTHTLELVLHVDAEFAQQLGLADAGMLQHAGRLHRAT